MAMKESENSLRAYFLLAGIVSGFANLNVLIHGNTTIFGLVFAGASIIAAIGLLIADWSLRELLRHRLGFLKGLLYALIGLNLVRIIYGATVNPGPSAFVGPVFSIAIVVYLLMNVCRLAREKSSQSPPADPFQANATEETR